MHKMSSARKQKVCQYSEELVLYLKISIFSQMRAQFDLLLLLLYKHRYQLAWFKFSNLITPLRVSKEMEISGLDGPEMGVLGYPEFAINRD